MACTDLRKVWTKVKAHDRKVLKCFDKKPAKKKRGRKKKMEVKNPENDTRRYSV